MVSRRPAAILLPEVNTLSVVGGPKATIILKACGSRAVLVGLPFPDAGSALGLLGMGLMGRGCLAAQAGWFGRLFPPKAPAAEPLRTGQHHCSADLQSAVSPICNRQARGELDVRGFISTAAGCKPAIQQIANLRYEAGVCAPIARRIHIAASSSTPFRMGEVATGKIRQGFINSGGVE